MYSVLKEQILSKRLQRAAERARLLDAALRQQPPEGRTLFIHAEGNLSHLDLQE